jgi:hypothetical protein
MNNIELPRRNYEKVGTHINIGPRRNNRKIGMRIIV